MTTFFTVEDALIQLHLLTNQAPPSVNDFGGAADGLVRLQRTYKLSTRKILAGNIHGYHSVKKLSATDAFYLGTSAVNMKEWGYAAQWLKIAWQLHSNKLYTGPIAFKLATSYIQMKDFVRVHEFLKVALKEYFSDPRGEACVDEEEKCGRYAREGMCNKNAKFMLKNCRFSCMICTNRRQEHYTGENKIINIYHLVNKKLNTMDNPQPLPEPNTIRLRNESIVDKYEKLCRGRAIKRYKNAGCKLRPALILWNVYKEEVLHLNPRISLIYDIISDEEADKLINLSKSKMKRAVVGGSRELSQSRVSNVGWFEDTDDFVRMLSRRVALITGLEVERRLTLDNKLYISADAFQSVNYGIGGHYEPHHDFFKNAAQIKTDVGTTIRNSGDRIATFLLYLTKVHAGGGTVYPKVNIQVPPTKNAAAFWYNAELSGKYDDLTMHAGCPVLLGEKWVCNKWIREYGNQFKRRCPLDEDAFYTMKDIG